MILNDLIFCQFSLIIYQKLRSGFLTLDWCGNIDCRYFQQVFDKHSFKCSFTCIYFPHRNRPSHVAFARTGLL